MVLRQAVVLVGAGAGIGLLAALAVTQLLARHPSEHLAHGGTAFQRAAVCGHSQHDGAGLHAK
jgi:hypothetical protein